VFGDLGPVDLLEVRGDFPRGQPPGGQREDDLLDPVQTPFPFGHDHRLERAVPIPGHLNLDRADLGQHGLRPGAVKHVRCDRRLAMLVPEVLGQLRFQRGLQTKGLSIHKLR
jgi:hypothetical protein